jgi:hypothetical protein
MTEVLREAIIQKALEVIAYRSKEPEVMHQLHVLVNSGGDTLPDDEILKELEGLAAGGSRLMRVFADNTPNDSTGLRA